MSQNKDKGGKAPENDGFVVRIRGLPWSASKDDIVKFFEGCTLKNESQGIHLTMSREGRPSGEAYIELEGEDDLAKAMAKDNEHLGSRYIEVFQSGESEMEWALRKCGLDGEEAFGDACVRLRGLPFGCSKEEIAQFFTGLEIVRNGITLPIDHQGRSTGEAYVQFSSQEIAEKAMGKHKEKIGHRYIEIFKSSLQEIRSATGMGPMRMSRSLGGGRMTPYDKMDRPSMYGGFGGRGRGSYGSRSRNNFDDDYDGPFDIPSGGRFGTGRGGRMSGGGDRYFGGRGNRDSGTGHRVHMRGLPYRAVERDIYEFFAPLNPVSIDITTGPGGRPSGEADVDFSTHEDALKAMKRDKEKIQHRYIELFLRSEPEPFRRSGGNNMRGGNDYDMQGSGFGSDSSYGRNAGGGRYMSDDYGFGESGMGQGGMSSGGGGGSFGASSDRGFGDGYGSGGNGGGGNAQGFSGADRFADRSYNQGGGDRFGGGAMGRNMSSGDRGFGNMGGGGNYRNGSGQNSGMSGGGGGGFGNARSFTQDNDSSEFYGSGKLFGGENFQQSQDMMGANNYTSF